MRPVFVNMAAARLAAPLSTLATVMTVYPGQGEVFPNVSSGQYIVLTLQFGASYEIVHCTARAGDEFSIVRAQEGTTAQAWPIDTTVEQRITAGALNSVVDTAVSADTNAASAVSTASSAVTTASNAVTTANNAVTTANNAVSSANAANAAAAAAQSTADTALATANAALPRSGAQPMTGRLDLAAGTSGGFAFAGDTDTGFVQDGADTLRLRTGGTARLTATNALLAASVPVELPGDPAAALQAATKQYVDAAVSSVSPGGTPAISTTSGVAFDVTGIPSWARQIEVLLFDVWLNVAYPTLVQIGPASGIETVGYESTVAISTQAYTTQNGFLFGLRLSNAAVSGRMILSRVGDSNQWVSTHVFMSSDPVTGAGAGRKTIAGSIDRLRLTRIYDGSFTGGSFCVRWRL